ncbi:MAG TPA: hypothetical protein VIK35_03280 [Verrucomicrobiae bacterium]
MKERPFFHRPQSAAKLLPANPNRMVIQINWNEGAVETIKIQHRHIELVAQVRCPDLKSVFQSRRDMPSSDCLPKSSGAADSFHD